MSTINNLQKWAEAHIFYNLFLEEPGENNKILLDEFNWRKRVINKAPHGNLLLNNSFFKTIKDNEIIYLAHITPNLHNILENNILFPSSGCLVGSIYCVPVRKEGEKLFLHNLGKYIYQIETPRYLNKKLWDKIGILLIEIQIPEVSRNNLIGIDYLRLGDIHFNIYRELEYLLSSKERYLLEEICTSRIRESLEYLSLCNKAYYYNQTQKVDPIKFFRTFHETIKNLPILGYFWFEILSEFIMLYQNNQLSKKYNKIGEFYSPSYKNLIFELCPKVSSNFTLKEFNPNFNDLINYFKQNKIFTNLNTKNIISYLIERIIYLTNARLMFQNIGIIDWKKIMWNFDNLSQYFQPLIGHLIHRELRNFRRYPYFYFYFDQTKALQIWNYWNHMNIVIPFNGIIPKGEIGINPAFSHLNYKIYSTKIYEEDGNIILEPQKEIKVEIIPKLIDIKFTSLRNKDYEEGLFKTI
ncbi:MAG: hypothetical protein DDT19_02242 [Syntrophomonadaceae bacterium]|nr:hypothetical protein [Bacillota bacterium]